MKVFKKMKTFFLHKWTKFKRLLIYLKERHAWFTMVPLNTFISRSIMWKISSFFIFLSVQFWHYFCSWNKQVTLAENQQSKIISFKKEFNEFELCFKSAKNRLKLSADLNLETLNKILNGTNHIWSASQI